MDSDQVKWVRELGGKGPTMQASADLQDRKDSLLEDAFSALDSKVAEIRLGQDFAMEMKNTGFGGFLRQTFKASPKKMKGVSESGDSDDAFDTGHDMEDAAGLTAEQATALTKAHSIIIEQVEILRNERDATTKKPLFTDVEIAKEIFEPLMRRKIIPENAISDRYSDVSRTFESASSQYDLRLAAYTESVSSNDKIAAKLGLSSEVIKGSGTAATGIMGMLTALVPGMKDFPLSEATDICTAMTATLTAPLDISATLLKDKGLTAKGVEGIAKTVVGVATGWVTAAFDIKFSGGSDQDKINQQLGKAISAGLKIGLSGTTFAAKLAQGGDKAKEAFDELGTIVEQCLTCAGSGGAYRNDVKDDGALALLGQHIKAGLLGGKELVVIMTAAQSDDPLATVTKAMQNLVKAAIEDGAKIYATERQNEIKAADKATETQQDKDDPGNKDLHKQENTDQTNFHTNFDKPTDAANIAQALVAVSPTGFDVTSMMRLAQSTSKDQLTELFKTDPQLKGNASAQKLMLTIAAKRDQELETATKSVDEEVAKDEQVFRSLLSGSEALESDNEVETIELLILQIKKDQMIIKLAESFLKLGAAAVAAFLPPASLAVDAIQLAIAMRKAASHLMAWAEWNDNVTDAKSAMSVQVSAMANRAGLSGAQAARESVIALESAIKLVGDALGTAGGPFAPIGVGVSKGTSAVSSLKDIILKIYDEVQLKRNWEKYKKALDNPDDRKGIRAAIKGNATLAKYVIAYGGVIAGDPVAKNALRKCGLNDKVLQSPNTNEQKVVAYLEVLYVDDPVVLERLDSPPKWQPGPIQFTSTSIAMFSQAGLTKADPPFPAPINPRVIKDTMNAEASKKTLDAARSTWNDAAQATPHVQKTEDDALKEFVGCLNRHSGDLGAVAGSLAGWQPKKPDGKPHEEAMAYRAALVRIVTRLRKSTDREIGMYDADPL